MDLKILHITETCTGCGACTSVCPKGCLELKPDQDGFYYPEANLQACIECHSCEKVCHILTPIENKPIERRDFFAYKTQDDTLRQESTSGGAFSLFANYVISQGGVVFGSRYNGEKERLEVCGSDICGIAPLRKTKYIESYVGPSFARIRSILKDGKWVLYCGTPCQAAGLRHYINSTHTPCDKLIIIDFACHGVPSNSLFTRFKRRLESKKKKVVDTEFRVKEPADPKTDWHTQTLRLTYSDGTRKVFRRNSCYFYYYWPFDVSCSLRRSCYDCHQVDNSQADITIGDFWDIKNFPQIKDDNKGYSFIKIHNEDLLPLLQELTKDAFCQHLPDDLVKDPYNKSNKLHLLSQRDSFLSYTRNNEYYTAVRKYFGGWFVFRNTTGSQLKTFCRRLIKH